MELLFLIFFSLFQLQPLWPCYCPSNTPDTFPPPHRRLPSRFLLFKILSFPMGMACCCGCSVVQSCPALCDPTDSSTPGLSVPHHLLKFAQVHGHCISDSILPSHPLMPSSPSSLNLSQHQGLFQWVSCLPQRTKIRNSSISPSNEYSGLISLKIDFFDLFAVHFPTPQFEGINSLVLCFLYSPALTTLRIHLENYSLD